MKTFVIFFILTVSAFSHFCCGTRIPLQIPLRRLLKVTLEIIRALCNFMNIFYPKKLSSKYSKNVRKKTFPHLVLFLFAL